MTVRTISHSAPTARGDELHALAVRLYGLLSSGHDALAWNVDARGPALTAIGADGKRRPVQVAGGGTVPVPPWQRARELREGGVEVDRRFNPWVLERHLRGKYSVAPAAPGWVQWVALDIDAHADPGAPELVARRLAKERANRVLAGVWRALDCSAERHPLVLRSPGGGYHVWLPLTRGPSSSNPEHTWPAAVARAWVERHLIAAGLELAPGVLEVFPSGRCLRAPCGLGQQVLQATRPTDPDSLGLVPWPGTMASSERIDWRGERAALSAPVRRVTPMVRAFVTQWEAQRRTLSDWLGRPEASWDPAWGFLGWRNDVGEISSGEKNSGEDLGRQESPSQESDDVPGRPQAGCRVIMQAGRGRVGRSPRGKHSESPINEDQLPPAAPEVDLPPDPAVAPLVRGRAFREKVRRLLDEGITKSSTRHDAVLTLAFYWAGTCGLGELGALSRLEAWCNAHPHAGSRLASRPRVFRETCLREARHYIAHYAARWRFRGRGDGGGLATLTTADQTVLAAADPRVRGEVSAILAWLAGRADGEGRVGEPVQIATGLLARLCGDRRVDDDGKRRRTTTIALVELERLGVLTMAHNYRVGQRGRVWSCWYRFGSGELPIAAALPAAQWAEIDPAAPAPLVPTLAIVAPSTRCPDIASAPIVEVRVVGERVVPEGLLQVLSDGARGVARSLLTLAPDVGPPTAVPCARAPWFVRAFQARTFTPSKLWAANAATVIPVTDVEARRRLTRRERIAWGGGDGGGGGGSAPASVIPLRGGDDPTANAPSVIPPSSLPSSLAAVTPGPADRTAVPGLGHSVEEQLRAELAAEVGDTIAASLPIDVLEVACRAWSGFRRVRGP